MATVARIQKDGTFLTPPEINERLPVITNGLIAHYPLDSKAGTFDIIGGRGSVQNAEKGVNILDTHINGGWRNPANWTTSSGLVWDEKYQALKITGYQNTVLSTPLVVDTTKHYQVSITVMEEVQSSAGLYLGGYSKNILGEHVTPNYDYSYASNAQPTTGVWTTYRITRYGTGNITNSTSTSFDNTCGWMGTSTSITDKLTYKYYYGGLFNYSSGGVMYIKDCSIVAIDADTSNTIETIDGLAIQEATTNLVTSVTPHWGAWGGFTGSSVSYFAPDGSKGICLTALTGGGCQWMYSNNITVFPSTTYTVSMKIKATSIASISSNTFYIRQYVSQGGAQITEGGVFSTSRLSAISDTGYYFAWGFITTASNCTSLIVQSYEYSGGLTIWAYGLQVEQKAFATSYVLGTKSASSLRFPLVFSNNMTFSFEHYPLMPTTEQISQGTSPNIFEIGSYYTNASITFWCWGGDVKTYIKGDTGTGWQTVPTAISLSNANWLKNHIWTLVFSGASGWTSYKVYLDGTQVGTTVTLSPAITTISGNFFGFGAYGGTYPNAVYKNLSVYDRALTDEEIKKISGQSFKIATPRATIKALIENPTIPPDAYYYPLSSHTNSYEGQVGAYTSTNVAYEDSSAWVGTATTNYFNNPTDFSTSSWTASASKLTPNLIEFTNQQYIYQVITGALSTVHTVSWKLQGTVANQTIRVSCEGAAAGNGYFSVSLKKHPKTFSHQITTTSAGYANLLLYQFTGDNSNASKLYVLKAQAEAKSFATPFVTGTRDATNISYNFNASLGLNWSGNWSICYWKKPVATQTDNLTGYNIESLGCNSNSVGGGYMWWGKYSGADTVGWSSYDTITPATYFNQWHFVSIVKTGTSCVITWRLQDGQVITKTGTISTAATNYFVNQYGYDFKLGGWDNANPTNTYFSDLIVAKRALTAAELTSLYTQFSIKKTKVNSRNVIEDGV